MQWVGGEGEEEGETGSFVIRSLICLEKALVLEHVRFVSTDMISPSILIPKQTFNFISLWINWISQF